MNIYELMMKELRAGNDKVALSEDIVAQCNKAIADYEAEQKKAEELKREAAAVKNIVTGMNDYLTLKYGADFAQVDEVIVMEALEGVYGVLNSLKEASEALENAKISAKVSGSTLSAAEVDKIINGWIDILG